MKKNLILIVAAVVALTTGCSRKVSESAASAIALTGSQWVIEKIVSPDGVQLRPADIPSDQERSITFNADNSFSATTGCNNMGGNYTLKGDSIRFSGLRTTMMACPDMRVEQMLGPTLDQVRTFKALSANEVSLNSDGTASVILRKAK